jgi:hypothetical protein
MPYFPKSQITSNLHTNGEELVYVSDNTNYKGNYFQTSTGEYYSGTSPQDKPNLPLKIKSNPDNINPDVFFVPSYTAITPSSFTQLKNIDVNFSRTLPLPSANPPTSLDYTNGKFPRYFCKKTNQIIYLEINKDTYDKLVKQDPSILYQLFQPFTLTWTLIGNREQVTKNNQNAIERISNKLNMPMLAEFLKMDFTKYYKYSEASNLYTKGNELKTVQDNKMYIGFYHIHPDKGYMVGATHVLEPHAYLSPINGFSYSGLSFKDTSKPSPTSNTLPSIGGGMSSGRGMSGGGGY